MNQRGEVALSAVVLCALAIYILGIITGNAANKEDKQINFHKQEYHKSEKPEISEQVVYLDDLELLESRLSELRPDETLEVSIP